MLLLLSIVTTSQNVACTSTAGSFRIQLNASLAPLGVERFVALVDSGFMDGQIFYRVAPGFLIQFGVAADPAVHAKWHRLRLRDEPNRMPFRHGTLSFAGGGKDSRTTHVFVALSPHGGRLGRGTPHESTLGHIVEGMEAFERVVSNYQAAGYKNTGILQHSLVTRGSVAAQGYPKLDRILKCTLDPKSIAARRRRLGSTRHRRLDRRLDHRLDRRLDRRLGARQGRAREVSGEVER